MMLNPNRNAGNQDNQARMMARVEEGQGLASVPPLGAHRSFWSRLNPANIKVHPRLQEAYNSCVRAVDLRAPSAALAHRVVNGIQAAYTKNVQWYRETEIDRNALDPRQNSKVYASILTRFEYCVIALNAATSDSLGKKVLAGVTNIVSLSLGAAKARNTYVTDNAGGRASTSWALTLHAVEALASSNAIWASALTGAICPYKKALLAGSLMLRSKHRQL